MSECRNQQLVEYCEHIKPKPLTNYVASVEVLC